MKRLIFLLCSSFLSGSIVTGTEGLGRAFDDQQHHGLAKIHAPAEDARDLTPSFLKEDENGFLWYTIPVNNGVFTMSYQLEGMFELVSKSDDLLIFAFTGTINQLVSGNQTAQQGGNSIRLQYSTKRLPIRVRRWSIAESRTWGPTLMTFEDAQKAFEKNTEYPMKVALKTPEYIFFDNGDLLSIGAPQFHYEMNERRVGF